MVHLHELFPCCAPQCEVAVAHIFQLEPLPIPMTWKEISTALGTSAHLAVIVQLQKTVPLSVVEGDLPITDIHTHKSLPRPAVWHVVPIPPSVRTPLHPMIRHTLADCKTGRELALQAYGYKDHVASSVGHLNIGHRDLHLLHQE